MSGSLSHAVIALKRPGGQMFFGTVYRVRPDTLTLDVEIPLQVGESLEWRMELSGHRDTVMGSLRILQVQPSVSDGTFRVVVRLDAMPEEDRQRMDTWIQERLVGGTTRRYDHSITSSISSLDRSQASDIETRAALERLNQRRWQRSGSTSDAGPDLLGLSSEVQSGQERRSGRQAIRDALRASVDRKRKRAEHTEQTRALPSWAVAQQPVSQPRPDPEIERIPHSDPPRIRVRYRDPAVYARDYEKHLKSYALFLPLPELGGDGTRLSIAILPPSQAAVTCDAEIKVRMPTGVGVALLLDREQHRKLLPPA